MFDNHLGGYITFGGFKQEELNIKNYYDLKCPIKTLDNYSIPMTYITINSSKIPMEKNETILDSGATYSHCVSKYIKINIKNILKKNKELNDDDEDSYFFIKPSKVSEGDYYKSFPDINFTIGNSNISWHPREYLYTKVEDKGIYYLGIQFHNDTSNNIRPYVTLGANFMRQKQITFDLDNKQLLMKPSKCSHVIGGSSESTRGGFVNKGTIGGEGEEILQGCP